MLRRDIAKVLMASTAPTLARPAVPESCSSPCFPQTLLETTAGIMPADMSFPAGTPERYGAVGDGTHDDTESMSQMIACNSVMTFGPSKSYAVTTISFPHGKEYFVNFNGSYIKGIAKTPTTCIVSLLMEGSTFIGYYVSGYDRVSNPNTKYLCGTWWYSASEASQYNTFLGMRHSYLARGMVYGALPGQGSTNIAQSENNIYGWRTRGVKNPLYSNCIGGVLHFADPIFVSLNEEWKSSFDWQTARALEIYSGAIYVQGGEIQRASSTVGLAADLQNCSLVGVNVETASPIQVIGDGVQIIGGIYSVDVEGQAAFQVKNGVRGSLSFNGTRFVRAKGFGARSAAPIVDATAANDKFETRLSDTESLEWRWNYAGARVKLVQGGKVRFSNHRLSITNDDPNIYVLNTNPSDSLLDARDFDRFGYSTHGWYLHFDSGGTSTLSTSTLPGPIGYLARQLTMATAGTAIVSIANQSSFSTIQASCLGVAPHELFWVSCWVKTTLGEDSKLAARFFDLDGKLIADVVVADSASIGQREWSLVEGPIAVPPLAAYMAPGIFGRAVTVAFTDLRVSRAS